MRSDDAAKSAIVSRRRGAQQGKVMKCVLLFGSLFWAGAVAAGPLEDARSRAESTISAFLKELPAADRPHYRELIDEQINRDKARVLRSVTPETLPRAELDRQVAEKLAAFRRANEPPIRQRFMEEGRRIYFPRTSEYISDLTLKNGECYAGYLKNSDYQSYITLNQRINLRKADGSIVTKWNTEITLRREDMDESTQMRLGSEEQRKRAMEHYQESHFESFFERECAKYRQEVITELCTKHRYRKVGDVWCTRDEYYTITRLPGAVIRILPPIRKMWQEESNRREAKKRADEMRKLAEEELKREAEERKRLAEERRKSDEAEEKRAAEARKQAEEKEEKRCRRYHQLANKASRFPLTGKTVQI